MPRARLFDNPLLKKKKIVLGLFIRITLIDWNISVGYPKSYRVTARTNTPSTQLAGPSKGTSSEFLAPALPV